MSNLKILQTDLDGKGVYGLPDTPGLSTEAMQRKFDELVLDVVVDKFNALVDYAQALDPTGGEGLMTVAKYGGSAEGVVRDSDRLGGIESANYMQKNGGAFTGAVTAAAISDGSSVLRNIVVVEKGTDLATLSIPAGTIILEKK